MRGLAEAVLQRGSAVRKENTVRGSKTGRLSRKEVDPG